MALAEPTATESVRLLCREWRLSPSYLPAKWERRFSTEIGLNGAISGSLLDFTDGRKLVLFEPFISANLSWLFTLRFTVLCFLLYFLVNSFIISFCFTFVGLTTSFWLICKLSHNMGKEVEAITFLWIFYIFGFVDETFEIFWDSMCLCDISSLGSSVSDNTYAVSFCFGDICLGDFKST